MKEKLSYSTGKILLENEDIPENIIHKLEVEEREPTPAMELGTWVEAALVDGLEKFAVFTGKTRRGNAWEAFKLDNEDKYIVKENEMAGIIEAVASIKAAVPGVLDMTHDDHVEFEDRGIQVHGYTDFQDEKLVADLKVSDPTMTAFRKTSEGLYRELQAYIYARATEKDFAWIVCSPKAPYAVRLYMPSEETMAIGARMYERAHALFVRYRAGEFHEVKPEIRLLHPSRWHARDWAEGGDV